MTRRGLILFALMCVLWGIPYLLIRVAVRELSPETLVFARTAIAALLLVPVAFARGELRAVVRRWFPLLVFAAVEIALPWVLLSSAETHVSSSLAALMIAAVPLVGAAVARTTGDRERLGSSSAIGLLVGMAGVGVIVGFHVGGASATALVELALVVVGYAVGPILLSRYLAGLPALGVIAVSLGISAIVYAPIAAFSMPDEVPSGRVLGSVAGLAIACTAVAFVLFFALIAEIGPVRATVITYVNPAVAALLGVTILGESFTVSMGFGFVLVLLGSVLATRPSRRQAEVATEPLVAGLEANRP
jgi:drug/metabolite transporter (DMT)-like permease